jgi:hypothetical protein
VARAERTWRRSEETGISKPQRATYHHLMLVALVALGVLIGELMRRARQRRELEDAWRRENDTFLQELRKSR